MDSKVSLCENYHARKRQSRTTNDKTLFPNHFCFALGEDEDEEEEEDDEAEDDHDVGLKKQRGA